MNHFDTFSDETRLLFRGAQHEAERSQRRYISTEDLLLALIGIEEGVGAMVLVNRGVELAKVRTAVEFLVGDGPTRDDAGLTPKAKLVVELSIEEARSLEHHHIGTEHVLLALARERETIAAGVLESMGATLDRIRPEVIRLVPIGSPAEASSPLASHVEPAPDHLTVRWEPEGTVDLGALLVTASAKGFAGQSAAYFNASEVLDFAARLGEYPLSEDEPLEIRSGLLRPGTAELDEHVRITVVPVGRLGQVAVVVYLAEAWPARLDARSEALLELLTTYERLRSFSSELARVVRGEQEESWLVGEVLRGP